MNFTRGKIPIRYKTVQLQCFATYLSDYTNQFSVAESNLSVVTTNLSAFCEQFKCNVNQFKFSHTKPKTLWLWWKNMFRIWYVFIFLLKQQKNLNGKLKLMEKWLKLLAKRLKLVATTLKSMKQRLKWSGISLK